MVNPFDLKTALLAKHAQHVVLIHFPVGLFIAAVAFDLVAYWTKLRDLADAAYYNLLAKGCCETPILENWWLEGSKFAEKSVLEGLFGVAG